MLLILQKNMPSNRLVQGMAKDIIYCNNTVTAIVTKHQAAVMKAGS